MDSFHASLMARSSALLRSILTSRRATESAPDDRRNRRRSMGARAPISLRDEASATERRWRIPREQKPPDTSDELGIGGFWQDFLGKEIFITGLAEIDQD